MGSPEVASNRSDPYTLAREVGTPSISKFGGIPRRRTSLADHFPRGPFPAARRGAPLAELPSVSMEGIWGPGYIAVKIMGERGHGTDNHAQSVFISAHGSLGQKRAVKLAMQKRLSWLVYGEGM